MRFSFQTKLFTIVATAAVSLLILLVAGALLSNQTNDRLERIREQYLPQVELGPKLERRFETLRRAIQDAVAAGDLEALAETEQLEISLLAELDAASKILDPVAAAAARIAIGEFFVSAQDLSRRMIGDETGPDLATAATTMQTRQARAIELLERAAAFDRDELVRAFDAATRAQETAARLRLLITIACLIVVVALSVMIGRSALRSLRQLSQGLERFGRNDFSTPIAVHGANELSDVANHANRMAQNLAELAAARDRADWINAGQSGLADELRGDLAPGVVANRGLGFVAKYLEAPVATLYYGHSPDNLALIGRYAAAGSASVTSPPEIALGEGLVGQAALSAEITVIEPLSVDHLSLRSSLGESRPLALVLVPLIYLGRVVGVAELALLRPVAIRDTDLLLAIRDRWTVTIEVARSRDATRRLLAETQQQADRLARQEEELRGRNDEMLAQQEELRQTNDELSQQTEELECQRRELELKNHELSDIRLRLEQKAAELVTTSAYKSQFLTNMSHELRTPLNSMLLLSTLLSENAAGNLTDKQVEYARTIHSAGQDLLALINEVLDLAKVEAGRQQVNIADASLAQIVDHVRRIFEPVARDRGLELSVDIDADLPEKIATDAQRVEQILRNLLGNAIKFTERGGVTLRVGRPTADVELERPELSRDRCVAFAVSDTGPGVAPEHRERIFAPFEQAEATSDRRYGGTGLGLAIARELTTLLGGELRLDSRVGEGSTFVCYLPLESHAPSRPAPPAQSSSELTTAPRPRRDSDRPPATGTGVLLIVEDDPISGAMIGEVARSQGFDYVIVPSGAAALAAARERHPAGIVLDVRLPDIDGFTVMEQLRSAPETRGIPVHFISAVDAAERGLAMGAIGYLTKPVSRRELLQMIESFVPVAAPCEARVLVVEDDLVAGESLERRLVGEGYRVLRVTSAGAAAAAVEGERFACMILDLSLPDMDGLELLRSLQGRTDVDAPPVVVYTARSLSRDEAKRLDAYTEAIVLKDGHSTERLLGELRLFLHRVQDGAQVERHPSPRLHPADVNLRGKQVLIVDDDMRTVYALSATLRAKGANVLVADTGAAGLATLEEHPEVEAVLMDIMMPEMDGYEAMRRIRQHPGWEELPVIALTAKAMKGDAERCLQAGATSYLPKPIDADRLLSLLHTVVNRERDAV